ncbi:UvrD-helicase domain-containing protein [Acetobacter persici]|uniref:UvrD-helicase domain-containing protein n=1 Tax=Acetobacter persici TaxID=1076596 RepID=UPI001BAA7DAB|nr:UvrD-helicase domain-containing protein [Acetobacter persici]MBS0963790.1 ATP-dependent helicase [Acetobacter persici]
MDQDRLKLEPEVELVLKHVSDGKNFLLSGGAGSGKTYSLVQVIGELLRTQLSASIACITYTNAAVREIESRVVNERLAVSTIHDFLWAAISPFQTELRLVLIDLMSGDSPRINPGSAAIFNGMYDGKSIEYKEFRILSEGIISHDEVITLAYGVFEKYPKIREILRDRYRYILVDEYQDTAPDVIKILLDFLPLAHRKGVCGFFGDSMQSIYDDGVGSIKDYVSTASVMEVQKVQNRRNPRLVFELANRLRSDGLVQKESSDENAPNMHGGAVKDGSIRFYYTADGSDKLDGLRKTLGWNFSDVAETKELNLTHNLIAPQAGFGDLMEIYDKDGVLKFRDRLVNHIKANDELANYDADTFGEVMTKFPGVVPTPGMKAFIDAHPDWLTDAKSCNFLVFRRMRVDKDQLVDDKKQTEEESARKGSQRCPFIKHVFKILDVVHLYQQRKFNEFLRRTEFKLRSAKDKLRLKECINEIGAMSDRPIIEVIDYAEKHGLVRKDDAFTNFVIRKPYLFNRVTPVNYSSYLALYEHLEGRTTYSTQHKIKGREFDRVLVILDSGGWNKYNFTYLFEGGGTASVRERTEKLFYVCCTRSKESLAVYFRDPSLKVIARAKEWFGEGNVIAI